jgi:hypothetical protein
MNPDENIDNIAQTFFLLMILCSVISDSHFVIHERSPRIQYLFDSLQALFIFGFTQKQQERIVWVNDPGEKSVEGGLKETSTETPIEEGLKETSTETPIEGGLKETSTETPIEEGLKETSTETPIEGGLKETSAESSVEKSVTKVSFQEPIQTVLQPKLPPKKKKLLEDREKGSKSSKVKVLKERPKEEIKEGPKATLVKQRSKSKIK